MIVQCDGAAAYYVLEMRDLTYSFLIRALSVVMMVSHDNAKSEPPHSGRKGAPLHVRAGGLIHNKGNAEEIFAVRILSCDPRSVDRLTSPHNNSSEICQQRPHVPAIEYT